MSSKEIEIAVEAKLASLGLVMVAIYVAQLKKDDGWPCDAWLIEFKGAKPLVTDFYTGIGLRTKGGKPVKPTAASVLNSLLLDASAIDSSFQDWCSEYGYDDDSLKAFKTYTACCEIGAQIRKTFKREDVEALREILSEY